MRYKTKPVEIEAFKWTGDTKPFPKEFADAICLSNHTTEDFTPLPAHIHTLEGAMTIGDGDWIIKGLKGEFYPCKPDIFNMKYELLTYEK